MIQKWQGYGLSHTKSEAFLVGEDNPIASGRLRVGGACALRLRQYSTCGLTHKVKYS